MRGHQGGINGVAAGAQGLEHGQSGGHGEGISAEGSGLVDGAERRDLVHQRGRAAVGAYGESATNHLAQGGEVWPNGVELLCTAVADAEARHYLVKDQQTSLALGQGANRLEVAGLGRNATHVAHDRLDDDAGNLALEVCKSLFQRGNIVVGQAPG